MYHHSESKHTPNSDDMKWTSREPDREGHPEEEEVAQLHFSHPFHHGAKFWPGEMFVKVDLREVNLTILDQEGNVLLEVIRGDVTKAARVFEGIDALAKEIEAV